MNPQAQPVGKEPESPEQVFTGWGLEGSHSGVLLEFRRLMRSQTGFSLFFMQYNDPFYRDKLIPYLNRYAASPEIVRIAPNMDYPEFETLLFGACAGRDLVHVVGLTEWLAGKAHDAIFRGFNYHRELIAERVRAAVALWMTEDDLREFTLEAPDMWAWRKGVFDFSVSRREPDEVERLCIDFQAADVVEREKRIEEIESYLAGHPEETISRANLLREMGNIRKDLGRIDDALQALDAAREIYRRNGCKREHRFTVGDIARIHTNKGDVDTAYKLHQERLNVYEQLGDVEGIAHAHWSIARIDILRNDRAKAVQHLTKAYDIFLKLGRLDAICSVGLDYGQLLSSMGYYERGADILRRSVEGFSKLGRADLAAQVKEIIDKLPS